MTALQPFAFPRHAATIGRILFAFLAVGSAHSAEPELTDAQHYLDLFRPLATENAALSPDGELVAYSRRIGEELWVTVVEVDNPATVRSQVQVGSDTASTPVLEIQAREKVPARIEWMGWPTSDRLVVQTNQVGAYTLYERPDPDNPDPLADEHVLTSRTVQIEGMVYGFNADGSGITVLAQPDTLGRLGEEIPQRSSHLNSRISDVSTFFDDDQGHGSAIADAARLNPRSRSIDRAPAPLAVIPQRPTIVDFDPSDERLIKVRAGPSEDFDLYAIDVFTGRKRMLHTDRATEGRTALADRQQKLRIALPSSTATSYPQRYLFNTGRFLLPWTPLQEVVEDPTRTDFTLHPGNVLGQRSYPLGFDENPDLLYFASDIGRNTFGVYALQLTTGKITDLAIEHPLFDVAPPNFHTFAGPKHLVYDRFSRNLLGIRYTAARETTAWLRPDWQKLQQHLETAFPNRSVRLLEWDETRRRFLVQVRGPTEAGAFFVFDVESGGMIEFARAAPDLDQAEDAWTVDFVFERAGASPTLGRLTLPQRPVDQPTPVIILCPDNFWEPLSSDLDRRALALARMGFIVARFNGRGSWGLGRDHRTAIQQGYEEAQAREIVALVAFLEARFAIDPDKVALMGEGLGGFLALRTLQEFPEHFRGAIAINAPFDLREWIEKVRWGQPHRPLPEAEVELIVPWLGDRQHLARAPLAQAPETIVKPVQLFAFREGDGDATTPDFNHAFTLARALRRQGIAVELNDLHRDYLRGLPEAQARVHAQVAAFLNTHLFDYSVGMEEMEVELEEEPR